MCYTSPNSSIRFTRYLNGWEWCLQSTWHCLGTTFIVMGRDLNPQIFQTDKLESFCSIRNEKSYSVKYGNLNFFYWSGYTHRTLGGKHFLCICTLKSVYNLKSRLNPIKLTYCVSLILQWQASTLVTRVRIFILQNIHLNMYKFFYCNFTIFLNL